MAYRKPGNLKIEYQAKKFLRLSEICDEPLFFIILSRGDYKHI